MATEEEYVLDLTKMKIADLKRELQIRGLKVSGNKQDLIQRLQQYLEEHEGAEVEDDGSILEDEEEAPPSEKEATPPPESDPPKEEESVAKIEPVQNVEKPQEELTDEEKKEARAKKFGLKANELSNADRLLNRSKRFGLPNADTGNAKTADSEVDSEKLKQRAARFGEVISGSLASKEQEDRKRKRLERFGNISQNDTPETVEKKKKRAERFGLTVA